MILHAADELVSFFDPPGDPISYHGVPKAMIDLEDSPRLVLRSEEGFNFLPWYSEKASSLKHEAVRAVSLWRRALDQIRPDDPSTPTELFLAELIRYLEGVKAYAQVIFEMTSEGRVMVQEVRFGPEDSN